MHQNTPQTERFFLIFPVGEHGGSVASAIRLFGHQRVFLYFVNYAKNITNVTNSLNGFQREKAIFYGKEIQIQKF